MCVWREAKASGDAICEKKKNGKKKSVYDNCFFLNSCGGEEGRDVLVIGQGRKKKKKKREVTKKAGVFIKGSK